MKLKKFKKTFHIKKVERRLKNALLCIYIKKYINSIILCIEHYTSVHWTLYICAQSLSFQGYDLCLLGPGWDLRVSSPGIIAVFRFNTDTVLSQSNIVIFITTLNTGLIQIQPSHQWRTQRGKKISCPLLDVNLVPPPNEKNRQPQKQDKKGLFNK